MAGTRAASLMSVILTSAGLAFHALFLFVNWRFIVAPDSSPCFSSGASFGDCEPPLGAIGLDLPLCALLLNALIVAPLSFINRPLLHAGSIASGLAVSTLTFALILPLTLVVPIALEIGAVLVVLPLCLTSSTVLGLVASARLRGLQRLTGATCLVSASSCAYLFPFAFWLTFD